MKDYSINYDDCKNFILNYNIDKKQNTIMINFASSEKWIVPYNEKNESKIIKKMEEQVKKSEKFYLKQSKINRSAGVSFYILSLMCTCLIYLGIGNINPYFLYPIAILLGSCSIISLIRMIKSKSNLCDLEKNTYFLEIEEKLNSNLRKSNQNVLVNTSKKTKNIVKNASEDKPVFNINSFNHVHYSDIEQIMENIERNERFNFDYSYSEIQEKGKVRKKTRK